MLFCQFNGQRGGNRASGCGWCERIESVQFGFGIAGAVVRGCVGQSVAGQDSVQTAAANPVMNIPVFFFEVDKFDSGTGGDKEVIGGFGDVAAVVEPVGIDIRCEFFFDFTAARVSSGDDTGIASGGGGCAPDESINNHQVLW